MAALVLVELAADAVELAVLVPVVEADALVLEALDDAVLELEAVLELSVASDAFADPQMTERQAVIPAKSLGWLSTQSATHSAQMSDGRVSA